MCPLDSTEEDDVEVASGGIVDVDAGRGAVSTRHGALSGCHLETLLCTLVAEKSIRSVSMSTSAK